METIKNLWRDSHQFSLIYCGIVLMLRFVCSEEMVEWLLITSIRMTFWGNGLGLLLWVILIIFLLFKFAAKSEFERDESKETMGIVAALVMLPFMYVLITTESLVIALLSSLGIITLDIVSKRIILPKQLNPKYTRITAQIIFWIVMMIIISVNF